LYAALSAARMRGFNNSGEIVPEKTSFNERIHPARRVYTYEK
jgi:hypothetical protein